MLEHIRAVEDMLDGADTAKTDLEGYARILLARALSRAASILRALAADEVEP
jgi:hypothetical protein